MRAITQSEAAECGLASLAMVADAHGMCIGLPELRRRFPLSLKGAKLNHLIQIALAWLLHPLIAIGHVGIAVGAGIGAALGGIGGAIAGAFSAAK